MKGEIIIKKYFFVCSIAITLFISPLAFAEPSAILPNLIVNPGESFTVHLTVDNLVDLEGMDITIEFDEGVIDATGATLQGGILENENYNLVINAIIDGQIMLVFYATLDLFTGSGVVAYLEFDAVGNVDDSTPLTFTQFDVNEVSYLYNTTDGSVTIANIGADDQILISPDITLHPNQPNPFKTITYINYSLQKPSKLKIEIYNVKGQIIETLIDEYKDTGNYQECWDAKDVQAGLYFYQIIAGDYRKVRKCILLK